MSNSSKLLKGGYIGDYIGDYYMGYYGGCSEPRLGSYEVSIGEASLNGHALSYESETAFSRDTFSPCRVRTCPHIRDP